MKRPGLIVRMLFPLLILLPACGEQPGEVLLELSLSETEIAAEAGSVFVRVSSDVSWTLEISPAVEWASLSVTSGNGNKNSIILSCLPNKDVSERSLTVVATASGGKVTSSARLAQRGYTAPTPSGKKGGRAAVSPYRWLELPATAVSDGMDFLWHELELGGKTVRNWSCYWNYADRVSLWVAYPLCNAYLGSLSRSDAWGFDPLLSAASQQNVSGGYRVGNNGYYDRGHQIPSADRTASYEMNATTFYGTNMTPQLNTLNSGVWAKLEGKIRDWSKLSDTLFVVTGCVVQGASHYALDRSDVRVTVPTAYYKAVLRYKKDSTIGHGGFMGAAFWYDHEGVSWSGKPFSSAQSLSIAELEQKLGYPLFVNLPDRVGEKAANEIKTEKPANLNWWWNN